MKKKETLEHLRNAKAAHIRWVQRAKLLISGVRLEENVIPVNATECKFGKWLYSDGQILTALPNNISENIKKIEEFHFALHDHYLKIFNIYFSDFKKGFFAKLFHIQKKISPNEQKMAEDYYKKIEEVSKELINEINKLKRKIIAISNEEIEKVF